jgi:murein DD-endopeptidase MepM/ murein hydrolase activator NlpD
MRISKLTLISLLNLVPVILVACSSAAASVELEPAPTVTMLAVESPTTTGQTPVQVTQLSPTLTQPDPDLKRLIPTSTVAPISTPCPPEHCVYQDPFPFIRPVTKPGNDTIDSSYRFGSTQGGKRDPHHGVEFLNSLGTPVQAVADGIVVVAGDDRMTIYGPYYYFYGNLIVLQHNLPGFDQPLYTLYAHLSEILVEEGQQILAGEEIGRVGMTGVATGNHLHFEVRLGENTYQASRNPELWLRPATDDANQTGGAIAGRILANPWIKLNISSIVIERIPGPQEAASPQIYLGIYEEKSLRGLEPWGESFAVGDLQPGRYRISFVQYGMQQKEIEVLPGRLSVVTFDLTAEE